MIDFIDKSGKTILKKKQGPDWPTFMGIGYGWLETYFLYDEINNLRFVYSPKAIGLEGGQTAGVYQLHK